MPARKLKTDEPQTEQETSEPAGSGKKTALQQAQEKLARMEETNKLCFKHRTDYAKLTEALAALKFSKSEIDYLLKPKGRNNAPGYSWQELESQKQYIKHISSRTPGGDSHVDAIDEGQQQEAGGPSR